MTGSLSRTLKKTAVPEKGTAVDGIFMIELARRFFALL
jgi:hypothetical protein